jgi:hypothetical protein
MDQIDGKGGTIKTERRDRLAPSLEIFQLYRTSANTAQQLTKIELPVVGACHVHKQS